MAVWSAVSVAALEYSRIDAEFYRPTYLAELESWRRLAETVGVAKLGKIIAAPVRTGRTPASRNIKGDEDCIRFIKTDTVREGSIDFNKSALLPSRVVGVKDHISDDSIVMTIIGATPEIVGRTAIVRPSDPDCVTNQNVAVICTKKTFDPYFLTAYFQTKWGRDQVWRHSRRTEQVNLNCREVERILVPNPLKATQEAIGILIKDSFASADRSVHLYQQAQQLLEVELGLDKLKFRKSVNYTVHFSEIEASQRLDAEFFHIKYDLFLDVIRNHQNGWTPLSKLTSRTEPNFIAKKHTGDFDYIEISDVGVSDGSYVCTRIDASDLPANAKIELAGGEILVSQVRPTRGGIAIADDELENRTVASGAFYVCSVTDIHFREVIWLYLRCMRGVFEKYCGGTSYPTIESRYISRFPVPLFSEKLADQIRDLITASKGEREKSKALLEKAKNRVEKLIEEAVKP